MNYKFNIGIVGSGPAGYTAALHLKKQGLSVVLFEKNQLGGVCLNRGCIPTKAILHIAEMYKELACSNDFGINFDNLNIDYKKVIERKNLIVQKLRKGLELSLKNSGIEIVLADAKIIDKHKITANENLYECEKIIDATGAEPRFFKGIEPDHIKVLTSDDILELTELPRKIAIIGSGAIGIEWARIFSCFGLEVTIMEVAQNLLPLADIEVSKRIERQFKTSKMKIYKETSVTKIDRAESCIIHLNNGEKIETDIVLVAVGRRPINTNRIDGVNYLGDTCGEIQLAHYASKQAIEFATGIKFNKTLIPSVVYGNPEIAWVGKREQDLEPNSYQKSFLLISTLGKSHCDNSTDGFIKLLTRDNLIIGAHVISKEASALIQEITIAIQNDITVDKLKEVCFAHPTYSEGIFESLLNL